MRPWIALLAVVVALAGCLDGTSFGLGSSDEPAPDLTFEPGWPPIREASIRPGVKIPGCTTNFLFSNPSNTTLYLGTASHCVTGASLGQEIAIAGGVADGVLVYCSWGTIDDTSRCTDKGGTPGSGEPAPGFQNDFALIELPAGVRDQVHPALLHWGGPTQMAGPPGLGAHVLTYGNTSLRDGGLDGPDALDPREGYVSEPGPWTTDVVLAGPSVPGDSGSPVIGSNGDAVGSVQTVGTNGNGVTNLAPALEYLEENTDLEVELKTFDLLAEPRLPDRPVAPVWLSAG